MGVTIGWSSPVLAKMTSDNFKIDSPLDFIPTPDQQSYIASFLPLGAIFGPLIAAPLTTKFGRKCTLLMSSKLFISSFILLIFEDTLTTIYVARFLQGVANGMIMVTLPIYIGEISSPDCRGFLISFMSISSTFGTFFTYCLGPFIPYTTFQWICLALSYLFAASFCFMPETPYYLIQKDKKEKAFENLKFLRSDLDDVTKEFQEIEQSVEESLENKQSYYDIFKMSDNRRALLIGTGIILFQKLVGIDAILFYSETIFEKSEIRLHPSVATIIIGVVLMLTSFITLFFVDSVGRKFSLLTSSAGMCISLTTIGIYFFMNEQEVSEGFGWLPVTSLIAFVVSYNIGFAPLPATLLGELFALETKSIAISIAITVSKIGDFIVTKAFLPLESVIHTYGNFFLFSGFSLMAFIFTAVYVFETKGMTLREIQHRLNRKGEYMEIP